jgi:MFS family permease
LHLPLNRNLWILIVCQCIATGGAVLVVTMGGIVGGRLAPTAVWATLPLSLMVVGTAVSVIPASLFMRRIGRRRGFAAAALGASGAALVGAMALWQQSFALFCVCTFLIGAKVAFSQQYRFAAAESVAAGQAGSAISLVLLGSVGGAVLGPMLVTRGARWVEAVDFAGSFLALAGLFVGVALLMQALREPVAPAEVGPPLERRPLSSIVRQPLFLIAVLAGVVAQGVMTFIMTATPIAMHVLEGFTLEQTSAVIRAHVLAMYLPSLVSAILIAAFGITRLMAIGLAALAATLVIALQGHEYLHYWFSLVLLGVGWNFLFVGGTSLLLQSYRPAERFTAQAVNDFCVFGVAGLASLLAGSVVHLAGWYTVLWSSLPLVVLMAAALARLAVLRRRDAAAAAQAG